MKIHTYEELIEVLTKEELVELSRIPESMFPPDYRNTHNGWYLGYLMRWCDTPQGAPYWAGVFTRIRAL